MMLSKRDRNKIHEAILARDLDPAEFELEDTGETVTITHSSGSTFKLSSEKRRYQNDPGNPSYRYIFKMEVPEGIDRASSQWDLDLVLINDIPDWLHEIQQTVGVPDYWEELQHSRGIISHVQRPDFANALFTQAEQGQIAAQLQEIKQGLKEQFALTTGQMEQIEERLDEAAEASKRMGRKDWIIYFLGTISALIITATVTGGVGEHIFTMVAQGLSQLFTGAGGPPQILSLAIRGIK